MVLLAQLCVPKKQMPEWMDEAPVVCLVWVLTLGSVEPRTGGIPTLVVLIILNQSLVEGKEMPL